VRLPNADEAIIPPGKCRDYLLSPTHQRGRHKARVFHALGFRADAWFLSETALREQHLTQDAEELPASEHGRKYQIVAPMTGPNGRTAIIKSAWIILHGEEIPRFVSAYPE
jgi:hypothetical protein